MDHQAFVYILASQRNGTLYTGVTNNLIRRLYEHNNCLAPHSFTSKYDVYKLVWFLAGDDMTAAIDMEKKIKNRGRAWKVALIQRMNPNWRDLSEDILGGVMGGAVFSG